MENTETENVNEISEQTTAVEVPEIEVKDGDIEKGLDALLTAVGKNDDPKKYVKMKSTEYYEDINRELSNETAVDGAKTMLARLGMKDAGQMVDIAASGNLTPAEIEKAAKAGMEIIKHGIATPSEFRVLSHGKGKAARVKKKKRK